MTSPNNQNVGVRSSWLILCSWSFPFGSSRTAAASSAPTDILLVPPASSAVLSPTTSSTTSLAVPSSTFNSSPSNHSTSLNTHPLSAFTTQSITARKINHLPGSSSSFTPVVLPEAEEVRKEDGESGEGGETVK